MDLEVWGRFYYWGFLVGVLGLGVFGVREVSFGRRGPLGKNFRGFERV